MLGFFFPLITFNKNARISETEKRHLAERPRLFVENRINKNFFTDCDAYFSDRFGGREKLVFFNKMLNIFINKNDILLNDNAIQGKDGWLFFRLDGNSADYNKANLLNDEQLESFKLDIKKTADWCAEQRIKCIFLICPNKHSVYQEFYPISRPHGKSRADQLATVFNELGVSYIFPRDYLISKKSEYDFPLYYETDTHWNSQGAYLTSILLRNKIDFLFPNIDFPKIEYETTVGYSMTAGDILPMLGLRESKSTQPKLMPTGGNTTDYYIYLKNDLQNFGKDGIITKGANSKLPRALIYRDSFFVSLEPFVSPLFSEAEYIWKNFNEEDKKYVLQYKPDIIIFEAVERYALTIIQ